VSRHVGCNLLGLILLRPRGVISSESVSVRFRVVSLERDLAFEIVEHGGSLEAGRLGPRYAFVGLGAQRLAPASHLFLVLGGAFAVASLDSNLFLQQRVLVVSEMIEKLDFDLAVNVVHLSVVRVVGVGELSIEVVEGVALYFVQPLGRVRLARVHGGHGHLAADSW